MPNISFIFRICNLECNASAKKLKCLPADSSRISRQSQKKNEEYKHCGKHRRILSTRAKISKTGFFQLDKIRHIAYLIKTCIQIWRQQFVAYYCNCNC